MSLSLARRLSLFFRLFARRPDVQVLQRVTAGRLSERRLKLFGDQLPPELAAFARECRELEFTWVLASAAAERDNFVKGYHGGHLRIPGVDQFTWYPKPGYIDEDFAARALLDDMVNEGLGWWFYGRGQSPRQAVTAFENANDCTFTAMGSLEDYLTRGARRAFAWYWQVPNYHETESILQALRANSLPPTTAAAAREALVAAGATPDEAAALQTWLGEDVVVLLPRTVAPAAKQQTAKKTAKKTVKKTSVKKTAAKNTAKKKPAKKTATRSSAATKPVKKTAAQKTAAKKTAAKKTAAKKTAKKQTARRSARA